MRQSTFVYNSKTCQYEPARTTVKDWIWYGTGLIVTGALFFIGLVGIHNYFIETAAERALREENKVLQQYKPPFEKKLVSIEASLINLQTEDQQLYKKLFHTTAPRPSTADDSFSKNEILLASASDVRSWIGNLQEKSNELIQRATNRNEHISTTTLRSLIEATDLLSMPSILPIEELESDKLVSGFGERINPFHKGRHNHTGIDLAASRGTPVLATASGKVSVVSRTSLQAGYGNYIDIDHGNGLVTRYAHLEDIDVRRGDQLVKGEKIGLVGSSGGSIAPHLHYEVIRDGEPVDPINFMLGGLTSDQFAAFLKFSQNRNQSLD